MDGYEIFLALITLSGMSVVITSIAMFIESKMPDKENNDYEEDYQEEFLRKLQQDTNWW